MSQAFGANTSRSYGDTAVQSNAGFPRKDQRQEELQEMIERNIKQIKANTAELEKILEKISSGRENELLEKIARVIQETSTAATNVLKNMASLDLGQLCASSPQHRKQLERLQDDFRETVSKYYSVRNKIADQVKPLVSLSLSQDQTQQKTICIRISKKNSQSKKDIKLLMKPLFAKEKLLYFSLRQIY
ncbi:uncharacterized protein LOC110247845 isoform X2 [Exaiptasia diaphana]|uniref:Syntaxin N-terminal domain-containing protein n=1 Tax=Exaiptasia diaphana TaxID=2652724 RepID=A0A913YQ17_EXADI|nr:uncharacterized protein LOC110247845 isoform X2 [Exaiptasia diaphana]XP_028517591.1 uncharacterized protein LOC110247845 isoform X2 [Exaiptasia diaphana]XP_028517592.1 uncharacterized protein LOC110247845 isoform X2 [Exaiptasia diaphana]